MARSGRERPRAIQEGARGTRVSPRIASARLSGMKDCCKIRLRPAGYRLIYRVEDEALVILVVAVGRRDRNLVYKLAAGRP
ncbi:type II toxin-antitoxin system RelE/ParE family toxin [uncultured Sphingomonas sp.]|uniref:type II toxin-antitoxin system RelE family toxin n=1 Tax=uncultured Sphingomonas sp. TaxID=158754 RepID=UPI0035CC6B4A